MSLIDMKKEYENMTFDDFVVLMSYMKEKQIVKKSFNKLYTDLIKDERNYVSENPETSTYLSEEKFESDADSNPDNIPLDELKDSHYKSLRELNEFFNSEEILESLKEEEEEEEEEEEDDEEEDEDDEEEDEEDEEDEYLNKAKDFSKYVEDWKESYGVIDGETLKVMIMGKFFKKCDIDEDKTYKITYYYNKEENDNDYWIDCFFSIKNLSKKVFNVYYNTDSSFAYEQRSYPQLNS